MVFLGCSMYFQLEPITTLASGRFTLMKPEIFNCGVFSVTMTSNNAESVHGVYNIGFFFCSFAPSPHFHVEGILEKRQILTAPSLNFQAILTSTPSFCFNNSHFSTPVACSIGSFISEVESKDFRLDISKPLKLLTISLPEASTRCEPTG